MKILKIFIEFFYMVRQIHPHSFVGLFFTSIYSHLPSVFLDFLQPLFHGIGYGAHCPLYIMRLVGSSIFILFFNLEQFFFGLVGGEDLA